MEKIIHLIVRHRNSMEVHKHPYDRGLLWDIQLICEEEINNRNNKETKPNQVLKVEDIRIEEQKTDEFLNQKLLNNIKKNRNRIVSLEEKYSLHDATFSTIYAELEEIRDILIKKESDDNIYNAETVSSSK